MLNVNQATKNSYLQDSGNKQFTITFPDLNIVLTNSDLVEDSVEITERVNAGDSIEFIGCLASVLKFTTKTLKADVKGELIVVTMTCDSTESIPVFQGFVDEVEQIPHNPDKTITAYDILYTFGDVNVATWYNSLSFPITIKDFRDRLFSLLRISQATITLPADGISIVRHYNPTKLNALDLIKSICQINCVFGRLNRNGLFEYVMPPVTSTATVNQEITYYKEATYQEYKVKPVDKLTLRFSDDVDGDVSYGTGTNEYIIIDNFFARGLDSTTLETLAESLYIQVSGFEYQPFTANVNALPYIECVDIISLPVKDLDTEITSQKPFVILERTIKGIQALRDEYKADGDEYQKVFESDLSIQVEELKRQMEIMREDIDNLKFAYYLITNTEDVTIGDGETIDIVPETYFSAKKQSVVLFNCEVLLDVETTVDVNDYYEAVAKVTYYYERVEVGGFYPTETWQDGKHILNLFYYFIIQDTDMKEFRATLKLTGGSALIKTTNIQGSLYGQNLVASDDLGVCNIKETPADWDIISLSGFETVTDNVLFRFSGSRVTQSGDSRVTQDGDNRKFNG